MARMTAVLLILSTLFSFLFSLEGVLMAGEEDPPRARASGAADRELPPMETSPETTAAAGSEKEREGTLPPSEVKAPAPAEDHLLQLDGKELPLSESSVAAQVFTGDDLRVMGIHTLPEVLRYAVGVDVFQLNGFTYAAGIRGVDDEFNPRYHVYLDGRLVNVAEFGGVDWESIPVSVDDIERIEIIRAVGIPGEAGSALNGAIRIWTQKPADVPNFTYSGYEGWPETHIHFGRVAGSVEPFSGRIGKFSAKAGIEYRKDDGIAGDNSAGFDDGQGLFKFNLHGVWDIAESTDLSIRFAGLRGKVEETNGDPISNGHTGTDNYSVTVALKHLFKNGIRLSLQYYFEDFMLEVRDYPGAPLYQAGDDIDLDRSTHSFFAGARFPVTAFWDLTASGGWKEDRLVFERNAPTIADQELTHAHLGTELRLVERVFLSGGVQIERDLFAGLDFSPDVGGAYRFLPGHTLRTSYRVGRRRPNFTETQLGFVAPNPLPPPIGLPLITGEPDLDRETLYAWEGGYRGHFEAIGLLVDAQVFYHELKDKVELVPDPTSPVPVALTFDNRGREQGTGAELFAEWRICEPLSIHGGYTYQTYEATRGDDNRLKNRPAHKANIGPRLRFRKGLLEGFSAFLNLNWVSEIEQIDGAGVEHEIEDRFRLDFRVARSFWKDRVEIAFIGRNILDNQTLEFRPPLGSNFDGAFGAERMFLINLLVKLP